MVIQASRLGVPVLPARFSASACSQWSLPEAAGVNDADDQTPFRFTGTLNWLTLKLDRPELSPADIKTLAAAMRTKAVSE